MIALSCGSASADRAHLLTASQADWDLLLMRREDPFHRPLFSVPVPSRLRIESGASLSPTLERRGEKGASVSAREFTGRLWYAPNPSVVLALGGVNRSWTHAYSQRDRSLHWADSRRSLPLAVYYRGGLGPKVPFALAAMGEIVDGNRESWRAGLELRGREADAWTLELRHSRFRYAEDMTLSAPEADSTGTWQARYRGENRETGMAARRDFGIGEMAVKAVYIQSRPHPGGEAYQLSDSSQTLLLGAEWRLPAPGSWKARWEYSESQTFTMGLRRPEGSSDFKRFHHALGHGYRGLAGLEWQGRWESLPGRWNIAAFHRFYRYRNSPHDRAFSERKETLSYNRLESSFLATLYGGFRQSGELASAFIDLQSAEVRPGAEFRLGGGLSLRTVLPAAFAFLDIRFAGETVTNAFLSSAVERTYAWKARGPVLITTPGATLRYARRGFSVALGACHAVPVWNGLRSSVDDTEISGRRHGDAYPWSANGMLLTAGAALDF